MEFKTYDDDFKKELLNTDYYVEKTKEFEAFCGREFNLNLMSMCECKLDIRKKPNSIQYIFQYDGINYRSYSERNTVTYYVDDIKIITNELIEHCEIIFSIAVHAFNLYVDKIAHQLKIDNRTLREKLLLANSVIRNKIFCNDDSCSKEEKIDNKRSLCKTLGDMFHDHSLNIKDIESSLIKAYSEADDIYSKLKDAEKELAELENRESKYQDEIKNILTVEELKRALLLASSNSFTVDGMTITLDFNGTDKKYGFGLIASNGSESVTII